MALQSTTNPASNSSRQQTYFRRTLIPALEYNLQLAAMPGSRAEGTDIPGSAGALSIRFHKPRRADSANVETLTEGTPTSTFAEVEFGYVDATLVQHGIKSEISDVLQAIDIFNIIDVNKETLGADLAKKVDDTIRDALISGMADVDNRHEQFASTPTDENGNQDGSAQFALLAAKSASEAKMTSLEILKAVTTLKDAGVPQVPGGGYAGVVSPLCMFDLRQDEDWKNIAIQQAADQLWRWENWKMHGCRLIESNNPHRENAYGTYLSSGSVFSNFIFGANAYGCPSIKGTKRAGGKATTPNIVILNSPDKSDPHNQYAVVALNIFWAAKLLKTNLSGDVPYCVNIRAKSTY